MLRKILTSRWLFVASAIVLVSMVMLVVFARPADRSVDIELTPDSEASVRITCKATHINRLRGRAAFFDFQAVVLDPGVHRLTLHIQPTDEQQGYDNGPFPSDNNGLVLGRAQLGSEQWPMVRDEDYTFQLIDADYDRRLMYGKLTARVTEIPRGPQWFVAPISLLASLIQIGQVAFALFFVKRQRPTEERAV